MIFPAGTYLSAAGCIKLGVVVMWMIIGIIGAIMTMIGSLVTLVMAIKRNPTWKKWILVTGLAFIVFMAAASVDSSLNPGDVGQVGCKQTKSIAGKI